MSATSQTGRELVLLAKLSGEPVARCPLGHWTRAEKYFVAGCCETCETPFLQWRRSSHGTWEIIQ